jgi:hypothetical protein
MLSAHEKAKRENRLISPIRNNSELREHWRKHAQDMGEPGQDTSFGGASPT